MTKGELLHTYLEERGCRLRPSATGWQKVSCINDAGHPRGDRHPSASINLTKGRYHCFACGLSGDVYDIHCVLESVDLATAFATLGGMTTERSEEVWL
jgi:hypothetical protein